MIVLTIIATNRMVLSLPEPFLVPTFLSYQIDSLSIRTPYFASILECLHYAWAIFMTNRLMDQSRKFFLKKRNSKPPTVE